MREGNHEKGEYGAVMDLKKLLWEKAHESGRFIHIRTQNQENLLHMRVPRLRACLEARRAGGF